MPPKPAKDQKKSKSDNERETIKGLKKTVENLEKENSELKEKLKKNNEEIDNLKAIAGITGKGDNVSNQPNTNGRESRSAPPASTNDTIGEGNIQDQIKRLTDENKVLKEQLEKLFRVKKEKLDLKREFEELQKTQKEKDNKDKSSEEEEKNLDLTQKIKDLEKKLSQQEQENKDKLAEKERQNRQLTKAINDLKTENEKLKKANNPKSAGSRDLKAQVKHLKEENENLMEEKIKAVKEVDNLKNRLSQIAGSKQIDNNPGIADHSDPNRPLNLGERFSELYDNQWTDAMEEMT